ncbi:MAG: ATP-dependent RNA helicase HrpA [Burkholderiales bacterium]|nr:ATP-dependent RNA helicase HrpA [Burkholderiales bacterium]
MSGRWTFPRSAASRCCRTRRARRSAASRTRRRRPDRGARRGGGPDNPAPVTNRAANPVPPIRYPESLPVSARRDEIARALQQHPVVIVCGETGSGKTTQLPKIALQLGRGLGAGGHGLIGHTQPRRIAASSVAKRIAQELDSPLGEVVGFKVRFQDRLQPGASVKLMTDGILLAETQTDPLLRAYDTLIVDEAHERSLNIDFLLGHLRQILPRRPDLKLVVTSATIDAERFAAHFAGAQGPAPVIQVSGRLYPVEVRWRPFEWNDAPKTASPSAPQGGAPLLGRPGERRRSDGLDEAIADAIDELWRDGGAGDVLVFLPGEREIRDAADHLRQHFAKAPRGGPAPEVLPLFARLSQAEQDRVFEPGNGRRIVLATNVAETSLTVPGIRYVVDSGLARIKRYSYRSKVEQLQIEPISQAAANQRAGRCGRVADGICIRLYDEAGFAARPKFTDPEVLRSSLAGVILRMKSLRLGAVEDFPFLEAPPRKAIADGYALLAELGAVDEGNELTATGQALARLPLDPRVGRMILEARDRQALHEVLIIAAALSGQDVRDRPLEQQQAADEKHKLFDDEKSEFMGTCKLWHWIEQGRGVHGHAGQKHEATDQHKLSNRQQEQRLREQFISPRRVREWRDIHSQLHTVVAEHGWRLNGTPATYEQIHLSMLAGLLGNIGCKADDDEWYLGARGIRFWRHPGVNLSKRPGRWIVAAELVETTRLYGRGIAAIEPHWLPLIGGHLLKKQLLEPHWELKAAEVVALERATLYGLVVYANKRVNFGRVDPAAAREIFIRHALVEGDWDTKLPFLAHNRKLISQVQELEHKSRRQDVLVDDALIHAFYDQQLPADVCSGASLERWFRDEVKRQPKLLQLSREELMRHEAAGITTEAFPKLVRLGGVDCAATYLHEPGDERDGLTVTVPIYALNQVYDERCEWLVPGMLAPKVLALLKSLPGKPRARLQPLADAAEAFVGDAPFGQGSLTDALLEAVRARTLLPLQRADFKLDMVPAHLFMNLRIVDEHGRQLGMGRHLAALKAELGTQARSAFQALAALKRPAPASPSPVASAGGQGVQATVAVRVPKAAAPAEAKAPERYTAWSFGELPELMELRQGAQTLIGFPALIDKVTHVEIEVFDEPEVAAARHRAGLRRLVALQIKEPLKYLEKNIPDLQRLGALYMSLGTLEDLRQQIVDVALDRAFLAEPLPTDAQTFDARVAEGRTRLNLIAQEVARTVGAVLAEYAAASRKLKDARPPKEVAEDIAAQLQRLVGKRFVVDTPYGQLQHLPRYLKGITLRVDKLKSDPARDAARMAEARIVEARWLKRMMELKGRRDARLDEYRWLLEELRVSLFAQELRTPQPVSSKRLDKAWAQLSS